MIILDTNVLSELMAARPSRAVLRWFGTHHPSGLFLTTITIAEIRYGLALLPPGARRSTLESVFRTMVASDFEDRVLPFDLDSAMTYAEVMSSRRKAGRPIAQMDAQIAAIARSRGATLATRNLRDFEDCGVDLVDPWD